MKCPFCSHPDSKVVDSRPTEEGRAIRRRRECEACGRRFTTYETIEEIPLMVVKKDGSREIFDRGKLAAGIIKACEKRPVTADDVEHMVTDIENEISSNMRKEADTTAIGELVMNGLKEVDDVAYVRFASVYRQFTDAESFKTEIDKLLDSQKSAGSKSPKEGKR